MEHILKILPEYYAALFTGEKTCEVRRNDRDYKVGDILVLNPTESFNPFFLDLPLYRTITHVLRGGNFGISSNYVVLSLVQTEENTKSQQEEAERRHAEMQSNLGLFIGCIAMKRFSAILRALDDED